MMNLHPKLMHWHMKENVSKMKYPIKCTDDAHFVVKLSPSSNLTWAELLIISSDRPPDHPVSLKSLRQPKFKEKGVYTNV